MNGNCHFGFGAVCGSMLALNLDKIGNVLPDLNNAQEMAVLFVIGGLLGGIFPDIDNPESYMGKLTAPVSVWIGKIGELTGKTGKFHRGILHDPIVYLIGLYLSYCYYPALCGFFTGCLSHLFLDLFNPSGIPFLFGIKHLHLGKIRSGSKESIIFTWIMSAVILIAGMLAKAQIFSKK
ncbi:MAG: metal-dependent hydrolase [Oscillospiraceae bacterium]